MNIDSAHAFVSPIVRAYRALDASVAEAFGHAPADPAHVYQRAAGRIMAEIVWHAFMPVFHEHPDLERLYLSSTTSESSFQVEAVSLPETTGYVRGCIAAAEAALPGLADPAERAWYLSGLSQINEAIESLPEALHALSATGPSDSA
jgi:hypothetical protein